jgi:hypothetical protein
MIDELAVVIAGEIPEHINRWPYIGPIHVNGKRVGRPEHWAVEIEDLRIFARERPSYLRNELINYFNLSGTAVVPCGSRKAARCASTLFRSLLKREIGAVFISKESPFDLWPPPNRATVLPDGPGAFPILLRCSR